MGLLLSTRRALVGGSGSYNDLVMGTGPIAYWPLDETAGTVARCLVNPAQNGTYSSDVSTWPVGVGIGDGYTALVFDGVNDYVDVFSATLAAALNGDAGTMLAWGQAAAGAWTDAALRTIFYTIDTLDSNEYVLVRKSNVNNTMQYRYRSGAALQTVTTAGHADTAFVCWGITWDKTADEVKAWKAGAQDGATQNGLGVWAGGVDTAYIGSGAGPPNNPWHGGLARVILYDRVLPTAEILNLATV